MNYEQLKGKSLEEQAQIMKEEMKKELGFPWAALIFMIVAALAVVIGFYKIAELIFS